MKQNFLAALGGAAKKAKSSSEWPQGRNSRWRGGDRRDYELHQYVESVGDDRGRFVAKKAVEKGLSAKPWVKTSLAPGSKVVLDYLSDAGLMPYLEKLNFHLVGYGCTTCIGNSGPLPENVAEAVTDGKLNVAAVLSGNRNFEGRVNAAGALELPGLSSAGRCVRDRGDGRYGSDQGFAWQRSQGNDVYLADIWPTAEEVEAVVKASARTEFFRKEYSEVFRGRRDLELPESAGRRSVRMDRRFHLHQTATVF